ncbi:MAG: SLC13 family permease [Gemmatimonadetes bacterium]|nr:SLC13 family permease [Gemmatimonadota bacterium]
MEQIIFAGILLSAITLFATRVLPFEATSVLVLVSLALTGILTPQQALSGFSNPATITIAAMFVLSAGLIRTGALEFLVRLLRSTAKQSAFRLLVMLAIVVGLSSAFLNNTPIVVMMIPVALALSRQTDVKPSKLLLPISYFAILGGTCTVIGTSTNLLVDAAYREHGGPGFGIFDFAPLGICYFLLGTLYIFLFDKKLLPDRAPLSSMLPSDRGATFVTELTVGAEASLVGKLLRDVLPPGKEGVRLLEIVRGEEVIFAGQALDETVAPEDSLIVEGTPQGITSFIEQEGVQIASVVEDAERVEVRSMDLSIAEAVVLPDSPFVGRTVSMLGLNRLYGVKLMAIQRHGRQHRYHLRGMRLAGGDVMLLQSDRRGLDALRETGAVLVVEGVDHLIVNKAGAPLALGILIGVIALATLGVAELPIIAAAGVGILMATGVLRPREAIASMDSPVLFLVAGSIPLGIAMEATGLAQGLVNVVLATLGGMGPIAVLSGFYFLTSLLSSFLSNNATAVLMAPLAFGVASALGLQPQPFLVAIAFGASASFATPVGYQTNTIVMGPGGYTFGDYFRFGLPLNIMLWIAATILIPVFYPLLPVN